MTYLITSYGCAHRWRAHSTKAYAVGDVVEVSRALVLPRAAYEDTYIDTPPCTTPTVNMYNVSYREG
jgi:hypothetical protein